MQHIPCPSCGAPCLATDLTCLGCGKALRTLPSPTEPAPEPEPPTVPWWDAPQNQRRIAFVSGAVLLAGALFFLPGLLILWPFIGFLLVAELVMSARERAENAVFVRNVERGGGDRAALQAELARHARPDRIVHGYKGTPITVRGFDPRLGPESERDEAR